MGGKEIRIRSARADDADALVPIWQEMALQHETYDDLRWGFREGASEIWHGFFVESLQREKSIALVAADEADRPVGYLLAETREPPPVMAVRCRGHVWDICVTQQYRRRGIGRRLLKRATEEMRARGADYVTLGVAVANEAARGFYESLGLRPVTHEMLMRL